MTKRIGNTLPGWNSPTQPVTGTVHLRDGCGEFPRTSNRDRVTCPTCIVPEFQNNKTVVEEEDG